MTSETGREIPAHFRWSWHGGRRIHLGQRPMRGEVVVAGRGEASHKDLSCSALMSGRRRAIGMGKASGGFFAVPVALADVWVSPCCVCRAEEPSKPAEPRKEGGSLSSPVSKPVPSQARWPTSPTTGNAPNHEDAVAGECLVCDAPVEPGQRCSLVDGVFLHSSCAWKASRDRDRNVLLIEAGVTLASRRPSSYRRGKSPADYR